MGDWPAYGPTEIYAGGCISTLTCLSGISVTAPAAAAWPAANLALFVPFRLAVPVTIYKMVIGAGTTATGNFDVGIYDSDGDRIVSSGTTGKGASTEHVLDITDTQVGPGLYYLAMSADGTNNYAMVLPSGSAPVPVQKARLAGVLQAGGSFVLPATSTLAATTSSLIPNIAAYLRPD